MSNDAFEVFLEAMITGDSSQAILNQEKRGQQSFVRNETLPVKCNFCSREQLEQMGIEFGEIIDDLFINVKLPDGWSKKSCDHSMWSKLVDEQGRERASIFYKAAFYDRDAHISLQRRFSYSVKPVCGYGHPNYKEHQWHCVVKDCDKIIWESSKRLDPEPTDEDREKFLDWLDKKDELKKSGCDWLNENYPAWENPLAYWD